MTKLYELCGKLNIIWYLRSKRIKRFGLVFRTENVILKKNLTETIHTMYTLNEMKMYCGTGYLDGG